MFDVLSLTQGVLPPTASYAVREWRWVPAVPGADCDGELTIILQRAERTGRRVPKSEWDSYAVQVEDDEDLPPGVVSFLLENLADPDECGPFRCTVGGHSAACGCEAGIVAARRGDSAACKHSCSLLALISEGVFS